jgi:hypothetical protein
MKNTLAENMRRFGTKNLKEAEFQPLFPAMHDLPIVDWQRNQFDTLNAMYNAYLVTYANEKGEDGSKISPNDLNRKYGAEIRAKLGIDSIRTADIARALIKAGIIELGKTDSDSNNNGYPDEFEGNGSNNASPIKQLWLKWIENLRIQKYSSAYDFKEAIKQKILSID